ncbi:unnamed protein product [Onchocerca flexuosa]|uniref:Uncharacterized protein n=1 Tax=Onchocerca flexuosa TaxID=387005 RepID=A0A183HC02_9BILA|nr:unnamed protein product [Onchocerca flexuosa]
MYIIALQQRRSYTDKKACGWRIVNDRNNDSSAGEDGFSDYHPVSLPGTLVSLGVKSMVSLDAARQSTKIIMNDVRLHCREYSVDGWMDELRNSDLYISFKIFKILHIYRKLLNRRRQPSGQ